MYSKYHRYRQYSEFSDKLFDLVLAQAEIDTLFPLLSRNSQNYRYYFLWNTNTSKVGLENLLRLAAVQLH